MKRIPNLQILRGLAALNVVFFHIIGTGSYYNYYPVLFDSLRSWGASGVDLFFVISGFVITYSHLNHQKSFFDFLLARSIRIVPIYWFVICVVFVLSRIINSSAFNSAPPSFVSLLESLFFLSGALSHHYPIVFVGWTLEFEMLFYIIFSLFMLSSKWSFNLIHLFLLLGLFAIFSKNLIIMEFFLGVLVGYYFHSFKITKNFALTALIFGLILLVTSLNFQCNALIGRFFALGLPSVIILIGAIFTYQYQHDFFIFIGNASYSIYLIQVMTIPVFFKICQYFHLSFNADIILVACLLWSLLCGVIMHLMLEKPLTSYFKFVFQKKLNY